LGEGGAGGGDEREDFLPATAGLCVTCFFVTFSFFGVGIS
jgi:hypothetical protein